ncbi:peroxisomal membrane protein PMP22 isoform X2 [Lathyrus oleraceus]|uniref:peroxisomal membrane protein PMP22 isoform X2 n=1 Tax=Pisum sativum TaxID=3888 RepID=UPI0021D12039|nr:peroxisomal membrane protein PMP22 isoform X2 [Pisum sativum]
MGSVAKNGLNNYVKQLQEHPLRTKVITAGVLSGISDIVSQKLTGIQKLQFKRLFLKVFLGAAYLGPFGHYFHIVLEKIFKGKKDSKTVAKKVLIEQLTSSPLNNLLFMIYYGLVIEVLARSWVDKLQIHASSFPRCFPQLNSILLGNILEPSSTIDDIDQTLKERRLQFIVLKLSRCPCLIVLL